MQVCSGGGGGELFKAKSMSTGKGSMTEDNFWDSPYSGRKANKKIPTFRHSTFFLYV